MSILVMASFIILVAMALTGPHGRTLMASIATTLTFALQPYFLHSEALIAIPLSPSAALGVRVYISHGSRFSCFHDLYDDYERTRFSFLPARDEIRI